jgi:hypothetical protein
MKQLGYAGLLPFLLLAVLVHLLSGDGALRALASLQHYAAVILTFVGAVHWGRALAKPENTDAEHKRLYWAVTPSLIGWIALSLPLHGAMVVLIAAFLLCLWVDRQLYAGQPFASWYLPMRLHLTLGVVAGLLIGWIGV